MCPIKYTTEVTGDWEAAIAALALMLLAYGAAVTWREQSFTLRRGALLGLGWGAALLISPALLPVLLVVTVLGAWVAGRQRPRAYLGTCLAASRGCGFVPGAVGMAE